MYPPPNKYINKPKQNQTTQNNTQPRPVLSTVTAVYKEINNRCKDREKVHWKQKSQARKITHRNLIFIQASQTAIYLSLIYL